ncbi:glycoside hydrolase [Colletotrichum sublineola]|nr:glycoside hydrolase [Colletotrichum sublineola]
MRALFVPLVAFVLPARHGASQAPGEARNSSQPSLHRNSSALPRNSSSALKPLYQAYSDKTPKFKNEPLIRFLQSNGLPEGVCAPGAPCTNRACCSNTGVCSYAPLSCGPDVCISNCDAKAPCGEYAEPGKATCPLNVCCSQYGFCGSTDKFCGDGCQAGFGGCGPAPAPSCSSEGGSVVGNRRIAYYESWATTKPCDAVEPEDLDLTSLTHLNFAFAFFDPITFQLSPMDANAGSLYSRFTALKAKEPGLETWIAVGGWSFNDDTNVPNTQKAFSNMYPVADDRGGTEADFANFPIFLSELRASLGSLGISVTLPSSFWYLQHFDLMAMQPSIDWFNVMSYDIHGVWDSSNQFTGPYIRPHTNMTEISQGLDLLWCAGVDPSKVTLGLGWYGRSFTLADPSCNHPNGVCQFTSGGSPGECSRSSGTLTNAEIKRILASGTATESYDESAGVRWMTWDTNQWVSYDDGVTMQQKMTMARNLCLGGIMIWAIGQDNTAGDSMHDLLGIGKANGVPDEVKQRYKQGAAEQARRQAVASSCYWSLCGGSCTTGYFDVAEARGSASGVQRGAVCGAGEVQTLCCAPGTTMGSCKWEGFRGVAFPCSPACSDPDATLVARNTNSYTTNEDGQVSDLTCMGGYQAYCCKGFIPSSITNSGNLVLYGQSNLGTGTNAISRRNGDGEHGLVLHKRGKGGALGTAAFCAALAVFGSIETLGLLSIVGGFCAAVAGAVAAIGFIADLFGSIWPLLDFGGNAPPGQTTTSCDCVVTYTCRYGMGWDEICDNQRWAIDKVLNGRTVFQPLSVGRGLDSNRQYGRWRNQRRAEYRTLVQGSRPNQAAACQLDEFPMGNLRESRNLAPQACRLVNGLANGAQGRDYDAWERPVATLLQLQAQRGNRGSGSGKRFLDAFGVDSQTPGSSCFASFTFFEGSPATRANTMIVDHGFRVLDNDPTGSEERMTPTSTHASITTNSSSSTWPATQWTGGPATE